MVCYVFPVEPHDGWSRGDLAYCVNPTDQSHPRLERGRVYRVAKAQKPGNVAHHGIALEGVDTGDLWGFWSNRFIKIGPVGGRLERINAATQYTTEHYWPWVERKNRAAERLKAQRHSPDRIPKGGDA